MNLCIDIPTTLYQQSFPISSLHLLFIPTIPGTPLQSNMHLPVQTLANFLLEWLAQSHRHPHTYLPVSTPNTIHHSRLTVCLPDSLDLDCCLSILFWLSACE